jgi:hypothetical protein
MRSRRSIRELDTWKGIFWLELLHPDFDKPCITLKNIDHDWVYADNWWDLLRRGHTDVITLDPMLDESTRETPTMPLIYEYLHHVESHLITISVDWTFQTGGGKTLNIEFGPEMDYTAPYNTKPHSNSYLSEWNWTTHGTVPTFAQVDYFGGKPTLSDPWYHPVLVFMATVIGDIPSNAYIGDALKPRFIPNKTLEELYEKYESALQTLINTLRTEAKLPIEKEVTQHAPRRYAPKPKPTADAHANTYTSFYSLCRNFKAEKGKELFTISIRAGGWTEHQRNYAKDPYYRRRFNPDTQQWETPPTPTPPRAGDELASVIIKSGDDGRPDFTPLVEALASPKLGVDSVYGVISEIWDQCGDFSNVLRPITTNILFFHSHYYFHFNGFYTGLSTYDLKDLTVSMAFERHLWPFAPEASQTACYALQSGIEKSDVSFWAVINEQKGLNIEDAKDLSYHIDRFQKRNAIAAEIEAGNKKVETLTAEEISHFDGYTLEYTDGPLLHSDQHITPLLSKGEHVFSFGSDPKDANLPAISITLDSKTPGKFIIRHGTEEATATLGRPTYDERPPEQDLSKLFRDLSESHPEYKDYPGFKGYFEKVKAGDPTTHPTYQEVGWNDETDEPIYASHRTLHGDPVLPHPPFEWKTKDEIYLLCGTILRHHPDDADYPDDARVPRQSGPATPQPKATLTLTVYGIDGIGNSRKATASMRIILSDIDHADILGRKLLIGGFNLLECGIMEVTDRTTLDTDLDTLATEVEARYLR